MLVTQTQVCYYFGYLLQGIENVKKIIITGAGGFLGGHLVNFFASCGVEVTAVFHREHTDNIEQASKRQTQKRELLARTQPEYRGKISFFDGDITDEGDMHSLLRMKQPNALLHAAALLVPPKESDYESPAQYQCAIERFIEVNQAKVLADCAAEHQKFNKELYCLLVSTIYVFGSHRLINEKTDHRPLNLYAKSKDEAQQYWESKNLNLAVVYPPQIFGPHQFTPAIMSRLIRKMLFDEGDQLTLNGTMNPIHVSNLTQLLYCLCSASEKGVFCVDGDGVLTLEEIANSLQQAANTFLVAYNRIPYTAFVVSKTSAPTPLKIDDTRLINFFKSKNPEKEPHQSSAFSDAAAEIVDSHWRHGQKNMS